MLKYFKNIPFSQLTLSARGFLLYSPISILGYLVPVKVVNNNISNLTSLYFGTVLTLTIFIAYLITLKIWNRFMSAPQIILFFLLPVILGAIRGLIFYYLVEYQQLNQPSPLLDRVISSTINTVFWLGLANYVIVISRTFLFQYQSALNQYLRDKSGELKLSKLSPENAQVLGELQVNLKAAVNQYLDKDDPQSFRQLSANISQQINEQIRPISRRIWIRNIDEFPVIKYRQLLTDSLTNLNFSWPIFLTLMLVLSTLGNLALRGISESFWRTGSYLLFLLVLKKLISWIANKNLFSQIRFNFLSLIIYGVIPVILSEYLAHVLGFSGDWIATLLISPIAPVLILVLSLLRLAQQDRSMLLSVLQQNQTPNLTTQPGQHQFEGASLATYLHNSLQSELMALSRQLEDAATKSDPQKSAELLQKVAARVNRSIADDFLSLNQSPIQRLDSIISSWQGILDLKISENSKAFVQQDKSAIILQVIEEVATNIARYDMASVVEINISKSMSKTGENFKLEFQSDGSGKLVSSSGIGSAWFDQVAVTPIILKKNQKGTHICLEI